MKRFLGRRAQPHTSVGIIGSSGRGGGLQGHLIAHHSLNIFARLRYRGAIFVRHDQPIRVLGDDELIDRLAMSTDQLGDVLYRVVERD